MSNAFVDTAWLEEHLADPGVRVIEASIARESFDGAHVPGAQWADFHGDLLANGDDTSGDVPSPEQFAALMTRLGITPASTIVWYGDRHSSYAIRGFWMCDFYRHPSPFYVLRGGREKWLAEGRPVEFVVTRPAVASYPVPAKHDAANRATWEDVKEAIERDDRVILDVRALEEYVGTSVRAARGGHIPGAVHIEWTDATNGDNALKSPDELRRMYEEQGITPDKEIIAHCQLGIRAAHTWFVLKHVLGYPNVKNYDGSWQEWGNRPDLPVER